MLTIQKMFKGAGVLLLVLFAFGPVQAQLISADSTKKYLDKLVASTSAVDKITLADQLKRLSSSNSEKDLALAVQYYYKLKNQEASDSVANLQVLRFPSGIQARSKQQQEIYKEKEASKMEAAYKSWIKKFPPENFITGEIDERLIYDYIRANVAQLYAQEKNTAKAIAYINMLEADFWKGNGYSGLSQTFYKNGDLANAEIYAKKAMESAESYTDGKKGDSNAAKFAASGYSGLTGTYANILFEEKKFEAALKYSEIACKKSTSVDPQLNFRYAQILMGLNRNKEAYDKLEEVVKEGKANSEMSKTFKVLYMKVKGSDADYNQYIAEIKKVVSANMQKKLANDIMNVPAANFSLKDLNGNVVSLASLKGKIVILDFWATWCGPCKASFPAMQMVVNKYEKDPNVKFLFIHTWEKTETAIKDAADYINANKYTFQVLMDLKDPATKVNKVVSDYKVKGIPSKFVIDANGNIRFRSLGNSAGGDDAFVEEMSTMIELAKKG